MARPSKALASRALAPLILAALAIAMPARAERVVSAPAPVLDAAPTRKLETAVFAGGCYWGVEGVFSHVKGVKLAVAGFAGGPRSQRVDYARVSVGSATTEKKMRISVP